MAYARIQFTDAVFSDRRPTIREIRLACTKKDLLGVRAYGKELKLQVLDSMSQKDGHKSWIVELIGYEGNERYQRLLFDAPNASWRLDQLPDEMAHYSWRSYAAELSA